MKFSGHNYNNAVFDSLLKNIELPKVANKKPSVDLGYTETTQSTFDNIVEEELQFMANELQFAAKLAHVELSPENLTEFAENAKKNNLKGKSLERAARNYCSQIKKISSAPIGSTKITTSELIDQAKAGLVIPASEASGEMNNAHKGAFLGQSKNPNSIWDSEALTKVASIENSKQFGDEQIKESKEKIAKFAKYMKEKVSTLPEPSELSGKKIIPSANPVAGEHNPNLGDRHLSVFSNDQDFSKIASSDNKELIKQAKDERQNKKQASKKEWNHIKGSTKVNNRSAIDKYFENLE